MIPFFERFIILDKLSVIGLDKVKEELLEKGVEPASLLILDTFLKINNVA